MAIQLKAIKREAGKDLNLKMKEGFVPCVYYGPKIDSVPIFVSLKDFLKVWREAGESTVVSLDIGVGQSIPVLIHEVKLDPVSDIPSHIDFYVFEKGKKISVSVPVEFVGIAPAVKEQSGILVKVFHELEVEAEPDKLPHKIEVDISMLVDFDSQVLAKDIKLPEGVMLQIDPEEVIVSVVAQKEEVVEEIPVDLSAIEVEKKGKDEEVEGDTDGKTEEVKK